MSNLTIESASSPVGPATGVGYLYAGGSMRFINTDNARFRITQVGGNVDVGIDVINVNPLTIFPQVLSLTGSRINGSYTITGTGQPNSTITINGVSAPVLYNGNFTITTNLVNGKNTVTQSEHGNQLTNSIYLINDGIPVLIPSAVVTSITEHSMLYNLIGSGQPGLLINIGDQQVTISSTGIFTVDDIELPVGINYITSDNIVIGSFYIQAGSDSPNATVTSIKDNVISGVGTPGLVIQINNSPDITISPDGTFSVIGISLNPGNNEITSDGVVIGIVYVEVLVINESVTISNVTSTPNNYSVQGTASPGTYTLAGVEFIVDDSRTINLTEIPLVVGSNPITNFDNEVVNSIYVQPDYSLIVNNIIGDQAEDSYIITVTSDQDMNIYIATTGPVSLTAGIPTTIPMVYLREASTPIYRVDDDAIVIGQVGMIYRELITPVSVDTITLDGSEYSLTGIGPNGSYAINGVGFIINDGEFSISNIPLSINSNNLITNYRDEVVGSVYLQSSQSVTVLPVIVTAVALEESTISGTGPDGIYIINGKNFEISGGVFTDQAVNLVINVNEITNVNNEVVGSVYIRALFLIPPVNVTTITTDVNDNTKYNLTGTGLDGRYDINGTSIVISNNKFDTPGVTLNSGVNEILNSVNDIVGSIYLQLSNLVPVVVVAVTPGSSDTYDISGTGPAGDYVINEVQFSIPSNGIFMLFGIPLVVNSNNMISVNPGDNVVGSVYVQSIQLEPVPPVIVTSMIVADPISYVYLIEGTGPIGGSYSINESPFTIDGDGRFITNASLNLGVNNIINADTNDIVSSIYIQVIAPIMATIVVSSVTEVAESPGNYIISGTGTNGRYRINLYLVIIQDGEFLDHPVQLNIGVNDILFDQSSEVAGSIYVQSVQPVIVNRIDPAGIIDSYTIAGTGPNGDYQVNGIGFTINDGIITDSVVNLYEGVNEITIVGSTTVVGSVYLR